MVLTQKDKNNYYQKKDIVIKKVILKNAKKKGHIVFGAKAVNKQLPPHLRKRTVDFDVFSAHPKKTANRVEKILDKKFGANTFKVEPAKHPGTFKIKSNVSGVNYADYSKTPIPPPRTVKRKGVRFAHTSHQLAQIKKSLADPESKFRHDKDRETQQRIKLAEVIKKKNIHKPKLIRKRETRPRIKSVFDLPRFV